MSSEGWFANCIECGAKLYLELDENNEMQVVRDCQPGCSYHEPPEPIEID